MEWLWGDLGVGGDDQNQDDEDDGQVDTSELGNSDDNGNSVDAGVTSGADPSSWDPIEIENNQ